MNTLTDVKQFYENKDTIDLILKEQSFGKNMWHTPINFNVKNKILDFLAF